jgi:RNA recognition motif-containing protein
MPLASQGVTRLFIGNIDQKATEKVQSEAFTPRLQHNLPAAAPPLILFSFVPQDVRDAFEKKTSMKLQVVMPEDKTNGKNNRGCACTYQPDSSHNSPLF